MKASTKILAPSLRYSTSTADGLTCLKPDVLFKFVRTGGRTSEDKKSPPGVVSHLCCRNKRVTESSILGNGVYGSTSVQEGCKG